MYIEAAIVLDVEDVTLLRVSNQYLDDQYSMIIRLLLLTYFHFGRGGYSGNLIFGMLGILRMTRVFTPRIWTKMTLGAFVNRIVSLLL